MAFSRPPQEPNQNTQPCRLNLPIGAMVSPLTEGLPKLLECCFFPAAGYAGGRFLHAYWTVRTGKRLGLLQEFLLFLLELFQGDCSSRENHPKCFEHSCGEFIGINVSRRIAFGDRFARIRIHRIREYWLGVRETGIAPAFTIITLQLMLTHWRN